MAPIENDIDLKTAEADLAYRRIDAILRAYGIRHAAIRGNEVQRVLVEAVRSHAGAAQSLESFAAEQVFLELDTGLGRILQTLPLEETVDRNRVLTALRKSRIPLNHPEALLGKEYLCEDELKQLGQIYKARTSPPLKRSSMGAPTLRFESIDELSRRIALLISKVPFGEKMLTSVAVLMFFLFVYLFAR